MSFVLGIVVLVGVYLVGYCIGRALFPGDDVFDPDYMFRLDLADSTVLTIGIGAAIGALAATAWLVRSRALSRRGAVLLAQLCVICAVLGAGSALTTAPVTGANIGGGLFIVLGLPILALLAILAVIVYFRRGQSEPGAEAT